VNLDAAWARCAPWIEAALAHAGGTHDLVDVETMVRAGDAGFWPGRAAAVVALIEDDPRSRRLVVWLAGGARPELEDELLPQVEAWGRRHGCHRALILGRPGWERTLKAHGYAPLARLIGKDL